MSRIGKQLIIVPPRTEVGVLDGAVRVKGPLGELARTFPPLVSIVVEESAVSVRPKTLNLFTKALSGTVVSHIRNMVRGVNTAYEKKLLIEGIGYRAQATSQKLILNIGFSHPVEITIPAGLKVSVDKNIISISGIDKELVGQFAATVRSQKKPEPYKGKGIRYENEIIRRKQGKRAA